MHHLALAQFVICYLKKKYAIVATNFYDVTSHSPRVKTRRDIVPPSLWIFLPPMQKNSSNGLLKSDIYLLPSELFCTWFKNIQSTGCSNKLRSDSCSFQTCIADQCPMVVRIVIMCRDAFWCLVIVPQKDDGARVVDHIWCLRTAALWLRSQDYLLQVGCCISLVQLSRHTDMMALSDYSNSQRWYGRPGDQ